MRSKNQTNSLLFQYYFEARNLWLEAYKLDSTNTVLLDWIDNVKGCRMRTTNNSHSEVQN
ncbi:MAG: hypothetical protein OCD01_02230 [Fibrobacterales bacterium]